MVQDMPLLKNKEKEWDMRLNSIKLIEYWMNNATIK